MRSKTSATLLLLVTFLLGGITGAIAHYLYRSRTSQAQIQRNHKGGPRDSLNDLSSALNLNQEQKAKLRAIIERSRDRSRDLSRQLGPQYEAIRAQTRQEIREILTPEQRERFEETLRHESRRPWPRDPRSPK